jgi:hypothetical protein
MRGAMVTALKGDSSMFAVPAQAESRKLAEGLGPVLKATMLGPLIGTRLGTSKATVRGDAVVFTDSDWATTPGGGPGGELRALVRQVPAHALIAIAYAPAAPDKDVREAVAWLARSGDTVQVRARVQLADPTVAEKLAAELDGVKGMASRAPACRTELATLAIGVSVTRDVATVRIRIDVPTAALGALVQCMKPPVAPPPSQP